MGDKPRYHHILLLLLDRDLRGCIPHLPLDFHLGDNGWAHQRAGASRSGGWVLRQLGVENCARVAGSARDAFGSVLDPSAEWVEVGCVAVGAVASGVLRFLRVAAAAVAFSWFGTRGKIRTLAN